MIVHMDGIIVGLIVLAAAGFLWRLKMRKKKGCGGGCGCGGPVGIKQDRELRSR